jgi:hypothetical protein
MSTPTFEVFSQDGNGNPVECSYCNRPIKRVVALPLAPSVTASNSNESDHDGDRWLGVCAYCVLAMAKALQAAEDAGQ